MKKVVSIVLITIILLSCCITTAFASGKITDTLQEQIDKADEDGLIRVQMWIRKPNYTSDEIEMLALKKAGLPLLSAEPLTMDELNRFIVAKRNIIFDLDATASREALGKIGIPDDRIVEISGLCVTAYMKPSEIITASESKEIITLLFDVVDDSLFEPVSESNIQLSNLFLDQFEELCDRAGGCCEYYQELYYHYDGNGDMDWVLVEGASDIDYPGGYYCTIGNRVFVQDSYGCPFNANYGIYDVNANSFVDISYLKDQGYEDFVSVFDQYGGGRLLGDLDKDNEISIADATILQRCDAQLMDYPKDDLINMNQQIDSMFNPLTYYSDFNRDGVRDILDVTYIQRYLVGMSYPVADAAAAPTAALSFEDIDNVYSHPRATVTVSGGTEPYTYCYKIKGSFHAGSHYGEDFGEYVIDVEEQEPGNMNFTTGNMDSNTTTIPVESLTPGDTFTLTVTVKDKNGRTSEPVSVSFVIAVPVFP